MNITDLSLFIHTADTGSITRAAEQLQITSATASAGLKRLEKQLGVLLFIRSTRQLRITAEGERFLVYCRKALANLEAGKAAIHSLEGKVAGELRISVPSDLGRNQLLGWFDEIMETHPDLSINLFLGDSITDFYQERVDLAIRYGNRDDTSVAFHLATIDRVLCASPNYLKQNGTPKTLDDLNSHNCLLFQLSSRLFDLWEFANEDGTSSERARIRVLSNRCSNDGDVVHKWAIAGKGIAYKSRLDVIEDIRAGNLIRVLPNYASPPIDLNLMSATRAQVTPGVLVVRDFLREKFKQRLDSA
jgi:DNA-binding transcriptional LysR family regulator